MSKSEDASKQADSARREVRRLRYAPANRAAVRRLYKIAGRYDNDGIEVVFLPYGRRPR